MDHKTVEEYILSMPNSRLDYPFGEEVAVYKTLVVDDKKSDKPVGINASGVQGAGEHRSESYRSYGERDAQSATQQSTVSSEQEVGLADLQATAVDGSWKMYALIAEGKNPVRLSLKCDPLLAKVLREKYETVLEGYHLNKKHWNTIILTGQLPWEEIQGFIRHSYDLVTGADNKSTPEIS